MTTGKTITLTRRTFVGKVMSLLFNMTSRLVITFLPRNTCLLISWLQSPSTLISHASKVMFKILQARLQPHVNHELPDVQAGFRKRQRNKRSNCQHLLDHQKSKRVPEKYLLLLYWLCQSLWLCVSQQPLENSERDGGTRPSYLPPEKSVCRSRSNS